MKFSGKVVVITGGSRGIGKAMVEKFCEEGAKVFFTYKQSLATAEELAAKTGAVALACNQENPDEIAACADKIFELAGVVDVLVNNAGITKDCYALMMPSSDWKSVIDSNLSGAFYWTKSVARRMYAAKRGNIIFISSVSGISGVMGQTNYGASKGGIIALSRAFAAELGAKNVRVNSISPGFVETDMIATLPRDFARIQRERTALKRFAKPEEIANIALFLASDDSSYITGQNIVADGGLTSCV